jgi:hypothetical protein
MELFREAFPTDELEYTPMPQLVSDELEKRVAEDASERIRSEFGAQCEVYADISVNSEGLIERVEQISVKTSSSRREAIRKRLCEVYGVDDVKFIE